jgi:hypothetical protein
MKNNMLMMISFVWLHNASAQYEAGVEQYYTLGTNASSIMPIGWYESEKGWSGEVRYNYEEEGAFSLYAGKTIGGQKKMVYSISAMAGLVMGSYSGASLLLNGDVLYKKIELSFQSQYTFSMQDQNRSFFYSWSDVSFRASQIFSTGVSLQQTRYYQSYMNWQPGFFAKAHFGNWAFPLYIFSPGKSGSVFIMGLTFNWQKEKKRTAPSLVQIN